MSTCVVTERVNSVLHFLSWYNQSLIWSRIAQQADSCVYEDIS